jgi:hypothetical protein
MQISDAQADVMTELVKLGYKITNIYSDGIVRMSNGNVGVFVRNGVREGSVSPPHTHETQIAQAELVAAGLTISI